MAVTFKNRGTLVTGTTSVAPQPNATLPVAGERSILAVGTKPETATINTPANWTLIGNVTGGIGAFGADTGPTRIALFYRDGAFSGAQTVSITSGNTSWAVIFTYISDTGTWEAPVSASGDDTTGGGTAYSALTTTNPGWTTGDVIHAACCVPTDAHTGVTAISINATGISGGTIDGAIAADSGTGNDIGGLAAARSGVTGTATSGVTFSSTFTAGTNIYGPTIVARLRSGTAPITGTIAVTEADDTMSASGSLLFTGTAAPTEGDDTMSASGTVDNPAGPVSGTIAVTEANDTMSASGALIFSGTSATTEGNDTMSASGTNTPPAVTGTIAVTEGADTMSASGTVSGVGPQLPTDVNDEIFQALAQENYGLDLNGALRVASGLNLDRNGVTRAMWGKEFEDCYYELLGLFGGGDSDPHPGFVSKVWTAIKGVFRQ